jgi:hypothetical protein
MAQNWWDEIGVGPIPTQPVTPPVTPPAPWWQITTPPPVAPPDQQEEPYYGEIVGYNQTPKVRDYRGAGNYLQPVTAGWKLSGQPVQVADPADPYNQGQQQTTGPGTYAPANYYNTANPYTQGQRAYSGQGTYMPQNPEIPIADAPPYQPVPGQDPQRPGASGITDTETGRMLLKLRNLFQGERNWEDDWGPGPVSRQNNPYMETRAYLGSYGQVRNWEDDYDAYGQPNRPYAIVKPPPTVQPPGISGGGTGTAPRQTYPGGGGGYSQGKQSIRFYLNPLLWRI